MCYSLPSFWNPWSFYHPKTPHEWSLNGMEKMLDNRETKSIPTEDTQNT